MGAHTWAHSPSVWMCHFSSIKYSLLWLVIKQLWWGQHTTISQLFLLALISHSHCSNIVAMSFDVRGMPWMGGQREFQGVIRWIDMPYLFISMLISTCSCQYILPHPASVTASWLYWHRSGWSPKMEMLGESRAKGQHPFAEALGMQMSSVLAWELQLMLNWHFCYRKPPSLCPLKETRTWVVLNACYFSPLGNGASAHVLYRAFVQPSL